MSPPMSLKKRSTSQRKLASSALNTSIKFLHFGLFHAAQQHSSSIYVIQSFRCTVKWVSCVELIKNKVSISHLYHSDTYMAYRIKTHGRYQRAQVTAVPWLYSSRGFPPSAAAEVVLAAVVALLASKLTQISSMLSASN